MKKYSITLDTLTESGVYPAWGECETIEIECLPSDLKKEIEILKNDFCHSLVANEGYEFANEAGFDLVKQLSKENVPLKVAVTWEEVEEDEDEETPEVLHPCQCGSGEERMTCSAPFGWDYCG